MRLRKANANKLKNWGKKAICYCTLGVSLISPTSEGLAEVDSRVENVSIGEMQIVNKQTLSDIRKHPDRIIMALVAGGVALGMYYNIKNLNSGETKRHKKFTKKMSKRP